jgi:hypothetical protein
MNLKRYQTIFYILKNINIYLTKFVNKLISNLDIEKRISRIEFILGESANNKHFDYEAFCLNGQQFRKKIINELLTIKNNLILNDCLFVKYIFLTYYILINKCLYSL